VNFEFDPTTEFRQVISRNNSAMLTQSTYYLFLLSPLGHESNKAAISGTSDQSNTECLCLVKDLLC
jgi:hypothetical protein